MSTLKQALIILLMIAYLLLPIDLIPDIAIGPGQIDDIIVIIVGIVKLLKSRDNVEDNIVEDSIVDKSSVHGIEGEPENHMGKNENNEGNAENNKDNITDKTVSKAEYNIIDIEDYSIMDASESTMENYEDSPYSS